MSDNVPVTTAADGDVSSIPDGTIFRADDVGGVKYQVVKLDVGGDGVSSPVTDLATGAKQDTGNTALSAIKTAVETIDNAISGSEMQVDVVTLPAIPAGTNNIGDVDIASIAAGDNNIGNVDVVTLPALPAGTNNIGDVDVLSLPALPSGTNVIGHVIVDTAPTTAVTGPLTDAELRATAVPVSIASVPAHNVTNAGTFAVQETGSVSTDTHSNVASSATSVTLLSSNTSRKAAAIYNDSTQVLYVKFGATASATSFKVAMAAGSYFEFPKPIYTGVVDGIWASANGNARITES